MKKLIFIAIVLLGTTANYAQQTAVLQTACASAAQGTAGSAVICYTIGEMVLVESYKKIGLFITSGVLQPHVPANTQRGQIFFEGEITVFPNPTPNILSIQYNLLQAGKMTAQVYDATGKRIIADDFAINSFSVKRYDLSKYANGMYILLLHYFGYDGTTIKKGNYKVLKQ
jgi:hypothetical protein